MRKYIDSQTTQKVKIVLFFVVKSTHTVDCFKITNFSFLCSLRINVFSHENLHKCNIHSYENVDFFQKFLKLWNICFEFFKKQKKAPWSSSTKRHFWFGNTRKKLNTRAPWKQFWFPTRSVRLLQSVPVGNHFRNKVREEQAQLW